MEGDPCDDNDDCTHHDLIVVDENGNCECIGEDAINSEEDCECGNDCPCPELLLTADPILTNGSDIELAFDDADSEEFDGLSVQISGGPDGLDLEDQEFTTPLVVSNLPPGYVYIITIIGNCSNGGSSEVSTQVDVPFSEDDFYCGLTWDPVDLSSYTLLPGLKYGDEIQASDFTVNVKSATGSYGTFSGTGYIKVPYFEQVRVNVSFKSIKVSAEYQMLEGHIDINGFGIAVLGDDLSDAINEGLY